MKKISIIFIALFFAFISINTTTAQKNKEKSTYILLKTDSGDIKIKLYNETPLHRDNFIKLASAGFFDSLLFHRVIKDFMIQGGDPNSKNALPGAALGNGGPGYTIPAEFNTNLIHKKGALSAARLGDQMNPKKESSGSQFYIVQGKKATDMELDQIEKNMMQSKRNEVIMNYYNDPKNIVLKNRIDSLQKAKNTTEMDKIIKDLNLIADNEVAKTPAFKYTKEQRDIYKNIGGTPFLDGGYTVFGEVVEGLDVIDKIAKTKTAPGDRPVNDIRMKMTLLK
jgi:cyclophilin family peptidyl-prolyl cis-trans isomerase